MNQAWKEDWKQDLKKMVGAFIIGGLLVIGGIMLLSYGKNFLMAVKPAYDMDYILDNGAKKGMHISGEITFIYDCFAEMENTDSNKITSYYYAIPAGDGMVVLCVSPDKHDAAERLLEETIDYLGTGIPPASVIPIEGHVVKAEGRLPYLLSQYMLQIGYTEEEIEAMGDPLMIQDTAASLKAARIYAPVGMILFALGILASVFAVFWKVRRR